MAVISLELLLVVVTAAVSLTAITCMLVVSTKSCWITRRFTVTKILHWEMKRRVEEEMCVDECVLIHSDHERTRKKNT